jgi:hypothetical protein
MSFCDVLGDAGGDSLAAPSFPPIPANSTHPPTTTPTLATPTTPGATLSWASSPGSKLKMFSRGADRGRTTIAAGTLGERFQSYVLESFHSLVSFCPA